MIVKRTVASTVLVLSTLTLAACGSFGGFSSDFNGRLYAGVGGLVSQLEPETNGVTEFSVDETQSGGGTLALGYDLSSRFSIEGHVSSLGEATFEPDGSIDYTTAGASALFYALNNTSDRNRREGFSVFGRLGVGVLENDAEVVPFEQVNNVHLLAGIGAEYGLSNGLGFRLEAVSHDADIQFGRAALVYRFGSAEPRRRSTPVARAPQPDPSSIPEAETGTTSSLLITDSTPLDSDGDGVLDTSDQCSDTPAGTPVGSDGCEFFTGVIDGIVFDSGSDVLTLESRGILGEVVDVLGQFPQARISISAHTDSQGPGAGNLELSKRRAVAVTRFLVEQGVDGSRLSPQAFGETQPIQSNDTVEGRAANRRVEFELL